jgi:hypothetical protein
MANGVLYEGSGVKPLLYIYYLYIQYHKHMHSHQVFMLTPGSLFYKDMNVVK